MCPLLDVLWLYGSLFGLVHCLITSGWISSWAAVGRFILQGAVACTLLWIVSNWRMLRLRLRWWWKLTWCRTAGDTRSPLAHCALSLLSQGGAILWWFSPTKSPPAALSLWVANWAMARGNPCGALVVGLICFGPLIQERMIWKGDEAQLRHSCLEQDEACFPESLSATWDEYHLMMSIFWADESTSREEKIPSLTSAFAHNFSCSEKHFGPGSVDWLWEQRLQAQMLDQTFGKGDVSEMVRQGWERASKALTATGMALSQYRTLPFFVPWYVRQRIEKEQGLKEAIYGRSVVWPAPRTRVRRKRGAEETG